MKVTLSPLMKLLVVIIFNSVCFSDLVSGTLKSSEQLNTTLIARLAGGVCETLALKGDTVVSGSGNSIILLAMSSDSTIQMINSTIVRGQIHDLKINNDFIYVLSEGNDNEGLYSAISIVKMSDSINEFKVAGSLIFRDIIEEFACFKHHLLLHLGESAELTIINVQNPALPYIEKVLTSDYRQANQWPDMAPFQFEFSDSLLFFVGGDIAVIKVSDSLEFEIIGRCTDNYEIPFEIVIDNGYLYLSEIPGYSIFDISTPESISLVTHVENTNSSDFLSLSVENSVLYLLSDMQISIYNISNPLFPEEVASYQSDTPLSDIAVNNNRLFVSQVFNGLVVLDYVPEASISSTCSYHSFGLIKDLFVENNWLYALSTNSELYVINIANMTAPVIEGSTLLSGYPGDIIVDNNIAYIAVPEKILLVDITDLSNLVKIDSIQINEYSPSLDIKNENLYVADGLWGIKIFDISQSGSPVLLGSFSNNRLDAADILVKGNVAYVLNFAYRQLSIFDISDPESPALTKEIQVNVGLDAKCSIWLNRLFIPTSQSITDIFSQKVEIFDISNPGSPSRTGEINLTDNIFSVCGASGDYLYTISRLNGLSIFHVADPLHIQELGHYSLLGSYQWNSSMIVENNIVMIANNDGLYIIQNDNNSLPSIISNLSDTTIARNGEFQFQYDVIDVDGDVLSFQIDNQCPGFCIDESTGLLEYTPGILSKDTTLQLVVTINDTKSTKRDSAEINIIGSSEIFTEKRLPTCYTLGNNYPNPFNPKTTIQYDIPKASHVTISICNINGQVIEILVNQRKEPGFYSVNWDASQFSSGVYFYQMISGDFQQVRKCILIK